ncbi:hypothetical protein PGQ11_010375 [Apiospora arundinis]|uniref:BTB domain-containing protein n=1 Tax=Apiospora arundinis TaxID=335852 RepID=A0ABR2I9N6_9PEZI
MSGPAPQPSSSSNSGGTSLFGPAPQPSSSNNSGVTSRLGSAPQPSSINQSGVTPLFGAPSPSESAPNSLPRSLPTSLRPPPIPCSNLPAEPPTKILDENGDLLLKVGTTKCVKSLFGSLSGSHSHVLADTFRVCSRTMARASPVWKKLLFGGFAESKPKEGEWKVTLPEDSPQAMSTLLGIVHAKFDAVPRPNGRITLTELYDITILTDKYDLAHVLKPWASMWLQCVWSPTCVDPYSRMEQLWITWNMGDMARFSSAATLLALNMSSEATLKTRIAPPGVSETIMFMHQDALNRLLKPFHGLLHDLSETEDVPNYVKGDTVLCCAQDADSNKNICNLLMLGYFTRALRTAGMIPQRSTKGLFGGSTAFTVSQTATKLLDIIKKKPALSHSHITCCPIKNAVGNITIITETLRFTPSEAQVKRLKEQALKSGLS